MKENILSKVRHYCTGILEGAKCAGLPFHNIEHTHEVVANTKKLLAKTPFTEEEAELVVIAAWFHDTGFCEVYNGHEEVSIKLVNQFFQKEGYDVEKINVITQLIRATKMPQNPKNELEQILCDADLFHVSTPNFFYRKQLLRKEWGNEFDKYYTDMEWHQLNLEFLQNHVFLTEYGKKRLNAGQKANILKVENLIKICKTE